MPPGEAINAKRPLRPIKASWRSEGNRNPGAPRRGFLSRALRVLALAVLLAVVAAPSMLPKYSVVDNDLWLHLKVGDWTLEHHAVPHTGILSRTVADRPWVAYSWIYEVLLSFFHSRFHLTGITVYGLLLTLAVADSVFWMTRRLSGTFWMACLLATACCAAFLFRVYPRPVFFSMMLFTITLTLLLESRRTGRLRLLYFLPPIFVLWANVHIQFIYGIFVVALFVAVSLLQEWAGRTRFTSTLLPVSLPSRKLLPILGACVLGSCLGPYSFHLYPVVFEYATSRFPYAHVREFQALDFRGYVDFVQLLMMGLAFFALGRKKQIDLFFLALLSIASVVGFRTQRDSWFICIPAAACLAAEFARENRDGVENETVAEKAGIVAALALLLLLYARVMDVNPPNLRLAINSVYPVQAGNFLHDHPLPGPLYNTYDWGDFISWYMPQYPVAIDGRTDLYGDDLDNRFYMTENGDASYVDDPYLNEANLVLLSKQKPLAHLLTSDSRFNLVYQDSQSMIFVRR